MTTASEGPALHSFAGNAAPELLVEGWQRLLSFSSEARNNLLNLVVPAVLDPADADTLKRLQSFHRDHDVAEDDALAVVQACGLLLRQASALDLDSEHFRRDLATLSNGDPDNASVLLDRYDELKGQLRRRIIEQTLALHGKVLVGIDWRVDQMTSSDRGTRLNASVVFLTLRYQDGDHVERITLQLTPESLRELKQFSERIG